MFGRVHRTAAWYCAHSSTCSTDFKILGVRTVRQVTKILLCGFQWTLMFESLSDSFSEPNPDTNFCPNACSCPPICAVDGLIFFVHAFDNFERHHFYTRNIFILNQIMFKPLE